MRNPRSIARARAMRKEPTTSEEKFWSMLRGGRYRGIKFRRQHAIGPYVVDFACVSEQIVSKSTAPLTKTQNKPPSTPNAPPISNAGAGASPEYPTTTSTPAATLCICF